MCFLYAVTYHLPSAYLIFSYFPRLEQFNNKEFEQWWDNNQSRIPFQVDKMKQRKHTPRTIESYINILGGETQEEYFKKLLSKDSHSNFLTLWNPLKSIFNFGRFSTWNWAQALKSVAGYNIESETLLLGENDSISFTDGLCYALGYLDRVSEKQKLDGKSVRKRTIGQ